MRSIRGAVIANWKLYPIPRTDGLKYGRLCNFCGLLRKPVWKLWTTLFWFDLSCLPCSWDRVWSCSHSAPQIGFLECHSFTLAECSPSEYKTWYWLPNMDHINCLHCWCSGIMQDSHSCDPGSIPGQCKRFLDWGPDICLECIGLQMQQIKNYMDHINCLHCWCSGIMQDSHSCDPGSIPGQCNKFLVWGPDMGFVLNVLGCKCTK